MSKTKAQKIQERLDGVLLTAPLDSAEFKIALATKTKLAEVDQKEKANELSMAHHKLDVDKFEQSKVEFAENNELKNKEFEENNKLKNKEFEETQNSNKQDRIDKNDDRRRQRKQEKMSNIISILTMVLGTTTTIVVGIIGIKSQKMNNEFTKLLFHESLDYETNGSYTTTTTRQIVNDSIRIKK